MSRALTFHLGYYGKYVKALSPQIQRMHININKTIKVKFFYGLGLYENKIKINVGFFQKSFQSKETFSVKG